MQGGPVRRAMVGELPADSQVQVPRLRASDLDGEGVEQHLRAEMGDDVSRGCRGRRAEVARPQFRGAREELTPPGPVLRTVAELSEHVSQQAPSRGMAWVSEDHVIEDLGSPAQVTFLEGPAGFGHHLVGAPMNSTYRLAGSPRRVWRLLCLRTASDFTRSQCFIVAFLVLFRGHISAV